MAYTVKSLKDLCGVILGKIDDDVALPRQLNDAAMLLFICNQTSPEFCDEIREALIDLRKHGCLRPRS